VLALALKGIQITLFVGALALTWMIVSPFARSQTPSPLPTLSEPAAEPGTAEPAQRYALIAQRNLFAAAKVEEEPEAAPEDEVEESSLNLRLLGTIVAGQERDGQLVSSALVRDIDGFVMTVGIGDKIAKDAASIVSIEQRRILIEHRGRTEAVLLDEEKATAKRPGSIPGARPRAPGVEALGQGQLGSNAELLNIMRILSPVGRFAADRAEDGSINGIRVTRIYENSPLGDLGVAVGDRMLAINGIPLGGEAAGLGALASLADGSDPILTIEDSTGVQREIVVPRGLTRGLVNN